MVEGEEGGDAGSSEEDIAQGFSSADQLSIRKARGGVEGTPARPVSVE